MKIFTTTKKNNFSQSYHSTTLKISKIDTTRLTYNCAHLRSTKESLTDSVKIFCLRKFFCVKIFLGENLLGEHFLSEHFFLGEIFWVNIFLSENCG